ncbi:MAG TPA: polysaccharide biosynthesis protein [Devosia sp.]|nr:polysaccharide biosynthesis protein [Devosia sp.]
MLDYFRTTLLRLPRPVKRAILVAFDFVMLSFAVWAAYSLRLNTFVVPDTTQLLVMVLAPLTAIPVFIRLGLYRSVIRYLPDRAFWTIANAVLIATLLWVGALFALEISRMGTVPRSLPLIYGILAIWIIGGSRFVAKHLLWTPVKQNYSGQVLIYGAGATGAQLANALHQHGNKYVAGFLDDDTTLHGREIAGIRVYPPSHIERLTDAMGIKEVILSMPSISSTQRQKIISKLSRHALKIHALPPLTDLASGRYLISQVREIDINDILGRSAIPADPDLLQKMLDERCILVSGAGGSIGSELCKLIIKWNPRKLILLEANEFALYQIERTLKKSTDIPIVPVLGSVTDPALVARTLKHHAVQVVFHAAAHKHVPLVEANVLEGVRNNTFGTQNIAKLSFELGVENFVLISTDKAVRPTNVMGATKRWAELIVRSFADEAAAKGTGQKFCAVRFGNVLGSNGSVVPLFKEQIAQGGPVTITDEDMTRYFMSIHEAAELIVQAGALSQGGDIFILEMGEPVRIRDLAENMVRLAGLDIQSEKNPGGEIAISIIGRRPGEKTHEELFYDPESAKPTRLPKILRARQNQTILTDLPLALLHLNNAVQNEDEPEVRNILFRIIEETDNLNTDKNKVVTLEIVAKNDTA